jgi:hypothetical protein
MRKRLCFLEIRLFSMVVPFIARLFPFGRILQVVEPRGRWVGPGLPTPEEVVAFVDRILVYRLLMRRQLCLRRSLVLYRFLRKLGLNVGINFGIMPPGGSRRMKAHAWLSLNGKPILEGGNGHAEFELIHSYCGKNA